MSKNILSEYLHKLGKVNPDAFVIQIGANDGISFDDTRGFLDMYKWPALLVEPIPEIFQELKDNFSDRNNYIFEQSAITNYDGPVVMLNVSRDTINKNDLHPGYKGMSALYPLKNGFGSDYERDIHVKNNLSKNITVNGITFNSLLSKHNITQFDVLICDSEGHDWEIFKQIDLEKYRPKIIRLEYINLNPSEQSEVIDKLTSHNYEYEINGQDIDAVDRLWLNTFNDSDNIIDLTLSFDNKQIDPTIINQDQIKQLLFYLDKSLSLNGDVVELGCFVGESSKYIQKFLDNAKSQKQLFVYDSFEGLPDQGEWEKNTGWIPGSLKTSESVLIKNFVQNNLKLPAIHKNWFKDIPESAIPNEISFAFLDGDFYESIHDSLVKIFDKVVEGGYICFHDWDRPDLPGVRAAAEEFLKSKGYTPDIQTACDQVGVFCKTNKKESIKPLVQEVKIGSNKDLTIVSGLWDIGRVSRSWDQYLEHFDKFLKIPCNLFLWLPKSLESFVWERRSKDNTFIKFYELEDIKTSMFAPFWEDWQAIRNDSKWFSQSGWLPESPQCKNEYYNPVVMSKMFFLNDAKIINPFNDNYLIWLDAGITQTVYENYFYDENILHRLKKCLDPFLFLSYPYEANKEIHGFDFDAINNYAGSKVDYVCRGGLFGGHKDFISHAHSEYYFALQNSLQSGFAGTEESIFSILANKSNQYRRYSLDSNGLIVKFIQSLFDDNVKLEAPSKHNAHAISVNDISDINTNLYFLTFNFPEQLEATIQSLQKHEGFLTQPTQKIIIDNSTNDSARDGNKSIAEKYGFNHISMGENKGICGGRQFAAEHFNSSDSDFYLFFEDDMTISDPEEGICRNGFQKYIPNLYQKLHKIMTKEKFDFLKLSYTEVYMDNNIQVSWYNVPQMVRESTWPRYHKLPETGLDPNCPRTEFKNINVVDEVSYISGEIYYANWPHITSRAGNKKMFIDTKWTHPYEQTWMSHIFQETQKGNIKPGILLASPVTHDRFKHYTPEERIEG